MVHATPRRTVRVLALGAAVSILALGACQSPEPDVSGQPAPGGGLILSDAEVGNITMSANNAEIQAAQLALQKSRNDAVRQFAQRMITDHTTLNQRLASLEGDLRGTTGSQLNQQINSTAQQTLRTLQQLEGAQFDRTYMQNQVQQHQWLLESLDNALIPSARNNRLEKDLMEARSIVASHLQQAQQIHGTLNR